MIPRFSKLEWTQQVGPGYDYSILYPLVFFTVCYWKWPVETVDLPIKMLIFNSYVSLPGGNFCQTTGWKQDPMRHLCSSSGEYITVCFSHGACLHIGCQATFHYCHYSTHLSPRYVSFNVFDLFQIALCLDCAAVFVLYSFRVSIEPLAKPVYASTEEKRHPALN